jgi:phospholipid/cholesterol/gamma-HCH transport system ATP-binding protein
VSIEIVNLHKAFGSKKVLQSLTLTVPDGLTTTVIGGSGTGKSVLLRHIVGLLKPDEGDVWVDGQNVSRLDQESLYELRRRVGYVFQFAALFDSMTVADNVGLGLKRVGDVPPNEVDERVRECLRLVDLDDFDASYPAELSGGQKKRAGLARAIATRPKYILYDEPTTGLDPVTGSVIDDLIIRMSDDLGVTGLVITHDMRSAFRISDRMAMLHEGRIRFEGTPDEFRRADDPVVKGFIEGRPPVLESVS